MRKITTPPACHPDRPYWAKGMCKQCYTVHNNRRWRANRPDKVHEIYLRRKDNPSYRKLKFKLDRNANLKRIGLSEEEYLKLAEERKNCAICKCELTEATRVLDHCHITNKFRDLLCRQCNVGLGNFKDSIELLQVAIEYLKRHKDETRS